MNSSVLLPDLDLRASRARHDANADPHDDEAHAAYCWDKALSEAHGELMGGKTTTYGGAAV